MTARPEHAVEFLRADDRRRDRAGHAHPDGSADQHRAPPADVSAGGRTGRPDLPHGRRGRGRQHDGLRRVQHLGGPGGGGDRLRLRPAADDDRPRRDPSGRRRRGRRGPDGGPRDAAGAGVRGPPRILRAVPSRALRLGWLPDPRRGRRRACRDPGSRGDRDVAGRRRDEGRLHPRSDRGRRARRVREGPERGGRGADRPGAVRRRARRGRRPVRGDPWPPRDRPHVHDRAPRVVWGGHGLTVGRRSESCRDEPGFRRLGRSRASAALRRPRRLVHDRDLRERAGALAEPARRRPRRRRRSDRPRREPGGQRVHDGATSSPWSCRSSTRSRPTSSPSRSA